MIHELRTYTLQPGTQAKYLQLSGEVGRKIRGDRFGKQEGFWYTEFGTLNQLVHLWSFPDLNERERLRGLLAKDEAWNKEYVPQIRPLLLAQENKILSPVLPLNPPPDPGWVYELRWYRTHVGR
ncbi:MAG TPA: NIPSNAP family protein, partial [Methylomirabilota bacterium]|nr:NIPSNAP family protein [Methylomirabilota bacterium]